ncbi:15878_t:CDS:2, partial [Cetraspora pellucida]
EESDTNESLNLWANSVISTTSNHSQLLLRMVVSNVLLFTFVENEDTIAVFKFLAPGIKLPKLKVIGGKVLMKSAQLLQNNIIKITKNDTYGVTATFDTWTNVKQEHILKVVFITTEGQSLI